MLFKGQFFSQFWKHFHVLVFALAMELCKSCAKKLMDIPFPY